MSLLRRRSRNHPEAGIRDRGWEVRHHLHRTDSSGNELYLPTQVWSELRAKASGALLVLFALFLTWLLTILFTTRFGHVRPWTGFDLVIGLQLLLWTILRQGMSIIALVAFDIYYASTSTGGRKTLSLYGLDAWMSLIITPINVFRGKFMHVLLVLLPTAFSIFAGYATSGLLGRGTEFQLYETGIQKVHVGAAGGGSSLTYVMTGQEFVYNASNGCLAKPNNRFVFVFEPNKVLIPSIPDIGTYYSESRVRAAKLQNVPSVLATVSTRVESNRSVTVPSQNTTVPNLGDTRLEFVPIDKSSSLVKVGVILEARSIHRQIYLDIHYKTTEADLLFASFRNGSHINQVFDVRNASQDIPARLNNTEPLEMESVLDNFLFSQNGERLLKVQHGNDTGVQNLGLLLAGAFGIRSATLQNWLDGSGQHEAVVYEEREVVKVPTSYWAVSAAVSGLLLIACILVCIRRSTLNGNLVQVVALLEPFIGGCKGAITPNWQKGFVKDRSFEDRIMNRRVMLGYLADDDGTRQIFRSTQDHHGEWSYRIAFHDQKKVTRDKLSTLYGLLAA